MEISEFFPQEGVHRTLYCDSCRSSMDLAFEDFRETVTGVSITILNLPVLRCALCEQTYLPERSKFSVIHLHERAYSKGKNICRSDRQKTNDDFELGLASFKYDSDDYHYIPGLARQWDDGFLTPVFFNEEVLLKYSSHPDYQVTYSSNTYGGISCKDEWSISFGVNKNRKIIMWLGDVAKLPEAEQYYLRSENVVSDHSIGSEFYDGQIECVFTKLSREDDLFKSRSKFLKNCLTKFGEKIAQLDEEVAELSKNLCAPTVNTDKERKHVADVLNKIFLESFDKGSMRAVIAQLSGDSKGLGSVKLLEKIISLSNPLLDIRSLMCPFYVLYDLRVAQLHLQSGSTEKEKIDSVVQRLGLKPGSSATVIYTALVEELRKSFDTFARELS